ncbi:MAG: transcriptional regulator, TetR family [Acidimicrobiales bacterium]|nr:transcriptional regulator, TetR family [Acidimicrobiales bacterium]
MAATVACLGRYGIAKTTVDDVAREAGMARATLYRHVPGGRDQLISEAITWEVGRFFTELAQAVEGSPDLATRLERALIHAHRAVDQHEVLQKVLETEPERLLPQLTESAPIVLAVLRDYLAGLLAAEQLQPGVTPEQAADWLARMGLSFIIAEGSWDLSDPAAVRRLVREQLLAGILATS